MDLIVAPTSDLTGAVHFKIETLTVWDRIRSVLYPRDQFLKSIGREVFDHARKAGIDFQLRPVTFSFQGGPALWLMTARTVDGEKVSDSFFLGVAPWRREWEK